MYLLLIYLKASKSYFFCQKLVYICCLDENFSVVPSGFTLDGWV